MFGKLPIELLLVILGQTPLTSYLSLSSTCKSLRSLLITPDFADRVMKESIAHGHLRWLSPVDTMPSEVDRANEIFKQWISVYVPEEPSFRLYARNHSLLPHFPCFVFVYACLHSDSMMNQERIWGMVKQYDALWMDYRTNGWKQNRFYYMRGSLYHPSEARRPVDYAEAETMISQ
jgi:F-box domain